MPNSSPITGQDIVTLRDNERKLQAFYVTAERQKWRDRIRELVIETVASAAQTGNSQPNEIRKLHIIRAELKVRLNLSNESEDKKIIQHITEIIKHENNYTKRLERICYFEDEVSWLLKEDWERVKYETRPLWLWCYPERKVDRLGKKVTKSRVWPWLYKTFSLVSLIAISIVVVFVTTGAINCAYQLT